MVEKASRLKITVLRRLKPEEIFDKKPIAHDLGPCEAYKDGQKFIVEADGRMPDEFCTWAWDDIYKDIQTLRFHGNFQWFTEEGASVNCCTDGLRPVIFRIERID